MPDDMNQTEALSEAVFQAVKVYVDRKFASALKEAIAPLLGRVEAVEAKPTIDQAQIDAAVEKAVSGIEIVVPEPIAGKNGEDGKPGADAVVDYTAIDAKVGELVKAQTEAIAKELSDMIAETVPTTVKSAIDAIPKPKDGTDGRDGRDAEGRPGRDAAELDILPRIIETRTYQRGTYASHLGALWRAARDTDAIENGDVAAAGWTCLIDGPARPVGVDLKEDGRTLVHKFEQSGRTFEFAVVATWPLDRGVWKPDGAFVKGDGVSYNGCFWIAQAETKDRPGTSQGWRLATKAGRDGKDMRPNGTIERTPVRLTD